MYSLPGRKDTALTGDRQPLPATPLATPGKSFLAGACLLMVLLTGLMTYPQVLHMRDGVDDAGDPLLNAWALSWVAHQLPINYLATSEANVLYGRWSRPYGDPERRLFAGVLPVLLALVALWPPLTRVRVAYALGLLFALDMSLGFNGFSYRFFYENLLPFRALRIPARMGLIVGFSLAVLAGHGVARVSGRLNPGRRALLAAVCSCLILYEYRSKPWDLTFVPTKAPVIYASLPSLAKDASSAVVELPIAQEDPTYMYYSTFHWRPLLNGYSGFFPKSYGQVVEALKVFPSEGGFEALRSSGTRYLLVHGELMNWGRYRTLIAALDGRQDVALVARQPWEKSEISLYELKR